MTDGKESKASSRKRGCSDSWRTPILLLVSSKQPTAASYAQRSISPDGSKEQWPGQNAYQTMKGHFESLAFFHVTLPAPQGNDSKGKR
ncbi:hypothetical protein M514_09204 [Trichuris suis]|uniref:Uncharacterized protein n=1 Tax=Trichuris suis TaxID=68888 RepID=A0A085LY29_9BILA|nr:hypothetical protein M513_09204 [Trichuris suis]KFD70246.1 hypothetical protein M514_09204 [Trichuris suis]